MEAHIASPVPVYQMPEPRQSGPLAAPKGKEYLAMTCRRALPIAWTVAVLHLIGILAVRSAELIPTGSVSGLPLPRFVSLKSDRVNVRRGPDKDHEVVWVYTRPALPVEITAEFDNWRRIRDWDGAEGWVYHSLLSGRRTALVEARTKGELVALYASPDVHGIVVARLEPGVLGLVKRCTGDWCRIVGDDFDGFVEQHRLWGVYPNETVD
jgi:SH3-like domain-containing protein